MNTPNPHILIEDSPIKKHLTRQRRSPDRFTPSKKALPFLRFTNAPDVLPDELPLSEVTKQPDQDDVDVMKLWFQVGLKRGHKNISQGKPKYKPEEETIAPSMELGQMAINQKTFFYNMWHEDGWLSDQVLMCVSNF